MAYHFYAMLHRMRYINRWSLMRNTRAENIQEHSFQVAVIAHALVAISHQYFADLKPKPELEQVLLLALFHDAGEILTGDLPTPVKYANPAIRQAYKAVESVAANKLLSMLPADLKPSYQDYLCPDDADQKVRLALEFVTAADKLSAYIKCLDEQKAGNGEFRQAQKSLSLTLDEIEKKRPEVAWFRKQMLSSFTLSLDELS